MSQKKSCLGSITFSMLGTVVDGILLLLVLVYQGSALDHYLIQRNAGSMGWYFWFLADFLILGLFAASLVFAFKHNHTTNERPLNPSVNYSVNSNLQQTTEESQKIPKFGILPFSYVSWALYSSLLVAKIVIIFKSGDAVAIETSSVFGNTSLKVNIAMSGVVFLLLVYSHENWDYVFCAKKSSKYTQTQLNFETNRQGFVNYLIGTTVFELLDCVTFLGILLVEESKIILSYPLENFVLAFSCINFLLPTITLYKLSLSNFGRSKCPVGALLLYKILHLLLVNIPYLGVRIYLWTAFDKDVSLFIVKNILGIFSVLRTIVPDSWRWVKQHEFICYLSSPKIRKKRSMELEVIYDKNMQTKFPSDSDQVDSGNMQAGPSFHEINLNDDREGVHTKLMNENASSNDDDDENFQEQDTMC